MQAFVEKHFYAVNLMAIGTCCVLGGLTVTNLIEYGLLSGGSPSAKRRPRRAKRQPPKKVKQATLRRSHFEVNRRNVFCSYCTPAKPAVAGKAGTGDEKPTLSMDDAELLATLVAEKDDKWSIATIRFNKTMQTRLVAKGTRIDQYEITKVEEKRVTFKRGKEIGYLDLFPDASGGKKASPTERPKPKGRKKPTRRPKTPRDKWRNAVSQGIRKTGPNKYEIERSLVQKLIGNFAMAGRDAAIYPHSKNGKPDGFRLGRVRPGGIFAKIGLRSGDVLNAVNNMPITSPDKALEAFTKLQSVNHLTIGLTRYGRPRTLDYSIK